MLPISQLAKLTRYLLSSQSRTSTESTKSDDSVQSFAQDGLRGIMLGNWYFVLTESDLARSDCDLAAAEWSRKSITFSPDFILEYWTGQSNAKLIGLGVECEQCFPLAALLRRWGTPPESVCLDWQEQFQRLAPPPNSLLSVLVSRNSTLYTLPTSQLGPNQITDLSPGLIFHGTPSPPRDSETPHSQPTPPDVQSIENSPLTSLQAESPIDWPWHARTLPKSPHHTERALPSSSDTLNQVLGPTPTFVVSGRTERKKNAPMHRTRTRNGASRKRTIVIAGTVCTFALASYGLWNLLGNSSIQDAREGEVQSNTIANSASDNHSDTEVNRSASSAETPSTNLESIDLSLPQHASSGDPFQLDETWNQLTMNLHSALGDLTQPERVSISDGNLHIATGNLMAASRDESPESAGTENGDNAALDSAMESTAERSDMNGDASGIDESSSLHGESVSPTDDKSSPPESNEKSDPNDDWSGGVKRLIPIEGAKSSIVLRPNQRFLAKQSSLVGQLILHESVQDKVVVRPNESQQIAGSGFSSWTLAIEDEEPELQIELHSKPNRRWEVQLLVGYREDRSQQPRMLNAGDAKIVINQLLAMQNYVFDAIVQNQAIRDAGIKRGPIDLFEQRRQLQSKQKEIERALERWKTIERLSHFAFDLIQVEIFATIASSPEISKSGTLP